MNVFLTTLMHPLTANDYEHVISHFELTARSICSQTDKDFKLVVVCNEIPVVNFNDPKIDFHVVKSFPHANRSVIHEKRIDKAAKLISGLLYSEKYAPHFIYICDADDWLHRNINAFMNNNSQELGFIVDSAFSGSLTERIYNTHFGMSRFSGSTFSLDYNLLMRSVDGIDNLTPTSTKREITESIQEDLLLNVFVSHRYNAFFISKGYFFRFKKFPFPAIFWLRNTGNNILGNKNIKNGIGLSKPILTLFSLQEQLNSTSTCNSLATKAAHYLTAVLSYAGSRRHHLALLQLKLKTIFHSPNQKHQ